MNPYELLEMFSIDIKGQGAMDWCELVCRLAVDAAMWDSPDWLGLRGIVHLMMGEHGVSRMLLYSRMKQAIKPLLEADGAALEALGIRAEKRTTTGMAWAVARAMVEGGVKWGG